MVNRKRLSNGQASHLSKRPSHLRPPHKNLRSTSTRSLHLFNETQIKRTGTPIKTIIESHHQPTKSRCVHPSSILLSQTGCFPFSVANSISNPASWKATKGTAVSSRNFQNISKDKKRAKGKGGGGVNFHSECIVVCGVQQWCLILRKQRKSSGKLIWSTNDKDIPVGSCP